MDDATATADAPSEVSREARTAKDFTDRHGAGILKKMIETYWREHGYEVEVLLVPAAFTPALRAARYDLRSHMLNGMPRNPLKDPVD